MKKIKKIIVSLVALAMLMSFSGCLLQVNQEKNRDITIVSIDGKYEIKKGDYLDQMNYYIALYSAYGIEITDKYIEQWRTDIIESLINEEICRIEMDKIGFDLNDEDREKAREDFEELIQTKADSLEEEAKEAAEAEEEADATPEATATPEITPTPDATEAPEEERDFLKEAREYYLDLIDQEGMTEEEYIDEMAQEYRLERFKKHIMSDLVATEKEIEDFYKTELDTQKLNPDMDSAVVLYEPGGVSYKYIKIALTVEEQEAYDKLVDEEKTTEAEDYAKERSYKRAKEYLDRINNGESFEDIIKEANQFLIDECGVKEDDIENQEEALKLYKTIGSTGFAGTLDTKLLAAAEGDVTSVLEASNGVYVIGKCYDRFESTTHAYEKDNDIYNDIKEHLEEEKRTEAWTEKLEELKSKHDIKTYTNRITKSY